MSHNPERICSFVHVDDNADDLYLVRHVAERSGLAFKLEQFESAIRFLADLTCSDAFAPVRNFDPPAFLLLDYHLGETEAPQLIPQVRAVPRGKSLPIIIYSGRDDIGDAMRAYQAGADHFLTKAADLLRIRLILVSLYCSVANGSDFSLLGALPEYRTPPGARRRSATSQPFWNLDSAWNHTFEAHSQEPTASAKEI